MFEKIENPELGHAYFFMQSRIGRLFLAKQVLSELGYAGKIATIGAHADLIEGTDYVKFIKKTDKQLFNELSKIGLLGERASEVIMISESGFWKLVMQSKKPMGIKTRHWLASEVLPSIRETGTYSIASNSPLATFTERKTQIELSKSTNAVIHKTAVSNYDYAKFWNELHKIVTGMTAAEIKELYKDKGSAKEVLRKHAPHFEATEAVIEDLWQKGIGLEAIKDTGLHQDLTNSFQKMLSLGVNLKELGSSAEKWRNEQKNKK